MPSLRAESLRLGTKYFSLNKKHPGFYYGGSVPFHIVCAKKGCCFCFSGLLALSVIPDAEEDHSSKCLSALLFITGVEKEAEDDR